MMAAMKRTTTWHIAAVTLVLAVVALAGCGSGSGAEVTSEEAEEAFIVAFGGAYVGSMAAQVGQSMPGVSINAESNEVVFEEFDVSDLQTTYDTLSGTIETTEESATADFSLTGGPVETISFDLTAEQMSDQDGISARATVNGREMDIEIRPEVPVE